jgi:hypothetical protein
MSEMIQNLMSHLNGAHYVRVLDDRCYVWYGTSFANIIDCNTTKVIGSFVVPEWARNPDRVQDLMINHHACIVHEQNEDFAISNDDSPSDEDLIDFLERNSEYMENFFDDALNHDIINDYDFLVDDYDGYDYTIDNQIHKLFLEED